MGVGGKTYREILAFYYPGTKVETHASDFHWTELAGEGVTLHTLRPDSDRPVIEQAEQILTKWRGRLPWPAPSRIDIFVYPDLDYFRNATGEPGWVAARMRGTRIDLQPVDILKRHGAVRSTLEHELIHCLVESAARPGLPVWFREGLAENLSGELVSDSHVTPDDSDIRQRRNPGTAQAAYRAAEGRVEALMSHYGETTVLTWVVRGMPAEVKNSTASNPAVNNK